MLTLGVSGRRKTWFLHMHPDPDGKYRLPLAKERELLRELGIPDLVGKTITTY